MKDSVRGLKNQCAGRVKDFLRKRAEVGVARNPDPTVFEPPIRKPPVPRERPAPRDFSSSPHGVRLSRGRPEIWERPDTDDDEDLDD